MAYLAPREFFVYGTLRDLDGQTLDEPGPTVRMPQRWVASLLMAGVMIRLFH